MSQDIAVIADLKPVEIFGVDKIDPLIGKIEDEVRSFHFDISTPSGRKDIASLAHKVARSKTALDAMGKGLTDEARVAIDAINTERRTMRDRLDALKEEVRRPLTEWEDKEKNRVKAHEDNLATITTMISFDVPPSSEQVSDRIKELSGFYAALKWEEFEAPAKIAFDKNEQALLQMCDDLTKREAEQAELERLRKENEEREAKERDERIAREAAEKATKDAEEKAKAEAAEVEARAAADREELERKATAERDASERRRLADQEKIAAAEKATKDAEAKAKQDADDAARKERQRIEDEKALEAKAAADREANKKHRAKINNEALAALKKVGLSEPDAKMAVEAIAKQQIPNVTISY